MSARILIVEDEPVIALDLKACVEQAGHHVAGIAESADEAVRILQGNDVDLLLLDINIKGDKDGVDLAGTILRERAIPFIFVTSYHDDHTLKRVQLVSPAAYIIKPFRDEDVHVNIRLALRKVTPSKGESQSTKLFVRDSGVLKPVKVDEILFAKGESNYTVLQLREGKKFTISHTLGSIEEKLPGALFCRVHKSYIINMECIEFIEQNSLSISGEIIPIGKAYRQSLLDKMQIL